MAKEQSTARGILVEIVVFVVGSWVLFYLGPSPERRPGWATPTNLIAIGVGVGMIYSIVKYWVPWSRGPQREKQIESGQRTADSTASIDNKMDEIIDTAEPPDDTPQPAEPEPEPMSARAVMEQDDAELADRIREVVEANPFHIPTPQAQDGGWFKTELWYKPAHTLAAYHVVGEPSPLMHQDTPADLGLPNGWRMENGSGRIITIRPKDHATPVPDHIYIDITYKIERDLTEATHCQRISLWLGGDEPPIEFDGCHETDKD